MKRKKLLLVFLFLFTAYFTVSVQGLTTDAQVKFDKAAYFGYGVQPLVILEDADLNVRPDKREEINVIVKSTSDPAGISVKLIEKSADSGIFTGFFGLGPAKSDDKNDKLEIAYNDTITTIYNDVNNVSGKAISRTCSSTWKNCTAAVEFSKSSYTGLHSTAIVTVRDQDLNLRPSIIDTASIRITTDSDSKGIVLTLNEVGTNTGVFSGSLKFSTAASNNSSGIIKIGAASNIAASYKDVLNSENVSDKIVTAASAFQFTEAVIGTSAENDSGKGNMLDITVNEPDSNNPDRIDTIIAKVGAGSSTNDLTIHMEETGANTGEFKYTVYFTDRESNRQLLYMLGKDKVNIKYADQTVPQGGSKEIVKTISWEYQSTILTLDKEVYTGYNTSAEITLFNMELNNHSDEIEYIDVDVVTNNSKTLRLELKETKKGSGKFTGTLYFGRSTDRDEDIIKMSGEDSITVSYTNRRDKTDIAECYADWSPQDGEITLNKQEYSGDAAPVAVTLADWDIAEDSAVKEEVRVIARIQGSTKDRTVTLTETKRDSGIFTGTFYINGGGGKNPSINLAPADELEVVYTDEDTKSGSEEERTANAVWTGISEAELTLDRTDYKGYGTYMTISLKDPDYNKSTTAYERLEVLIKTSGRKAGVKYTLRETGGDTGIFTASLKLSKESPNYSNVQVTDTDEITVTFVDKNVSASAGFAK